MKKHFKGNEIGEFDYDDTEFEVIVTSGGETLHYIGNGKKVQLPRGCTDCNNMFRDYKGKLLDLSEFDTTGVTDMSCMFASATNLVSLDLSKFDTSMVEDMKCMFINCTSLKSLNLLAFDTGKVRDMHKMFSGCIELEYVNLCSFKHNNLTDISYMFQYCKDLKELDLSFLKGTVFRDLYGMFYMCSSLRVLDLSQIKVEDKFSIFQAVDGCKGLETLGLPILDCSEVVTQKGELSSLVSLKYLETKYKIYVDDYDKWGMSEMKVNKTLSVM